MHPQRKNSWPGVASAILNGFLGDWLEQQANPLAIALQFFHRGQALNLSEPALDQPQRNVIIMIHGLTELDTIWDYPGQPGQHYASELASVMGATPLSLRYNSGRAIPDNGEDLATALDTLMDSWPVPVENLILIGHSMGGLLIRSACHIGTVRQHHWPTLVDSCVYLGSPHDGSWLARFAHRSAGLLRAMPRDYLRVIGESIDQRSDGIQNLSRGEFVRNQTGHPPLLAGARHFAIAGLLARHPDNPVNALFGDALVQEASARGVNAGWTLTDYACFPGIDHIRLTHHPRVCQQLKEWLL